MIPSSGLTLIIHILVVIFSLIRRGVVFVFHKLFPDHKAFTRLPLKIFRPFQSRTFQWTLSGTIIASVTIIVVVVAIFSLKISFENHSNFEIIINTVRAYKDYSNIGGVQLTALDLLSTENAPFPKQ